MQTENGFLNLFLDQYRSLLTTRLLDKIGVVQQCDCLRFEFPEACVFSRFKYQRTHDGTLEHSVPPHNRMLYHVTIVEHKTLILFFALDKSHYDKPSRIFNFIGTIEQLKQEMKPYYQLFVPSAIMVVTETSMESLPLLEIPKSEKTDVLNDNIQTVLEAENQIKHAELKQLDDFFGSLSNQ